MNRGEFQKRSLRMSRQAMVLLAFASFGWQLDAVTFHRSFRTRTAGCGFGSGSAAVVYPVDARIDKALDEARQKEADKIKVILGRCTRVVDGGMIYVVTGGNESHLVRLDGLASCDRDLTPTLARMLRGRKVRVEWRRKEPDGAVLGKVFLGKQAVNDLLMQEVAGRK